jgi:hypothetical protein
LLLLSVVLLSVGSLVTGVFASAGALADFGALFGALALASLGVWLAARRR